MTTKITPSVLENTAVVAATHGNGATIPVIVVDPQGRITGVTNTTIGIATSQVTSGTIADARLIDSGAVAGSYGSASIVPMVKVDAKGRATQVSNISIQIATSQITGYPTFVTSATTDTTNAGNISSGTLPDARLSNAGVNSGSFGSASAVPAITVDAKGRVTAVTATNIAIGAGAVSGLASSATTDTTNAGNISSGTLPDARLSNAGTSTGTFGSAAVHPTITVDAKGRVTAVTATSIAIAAGAVSGLATVATSGSYTDLSNRPSVPAAQVNSDWNAASGVAQILNKPSLFDGNYNSLSNKPTIPTTVASLTAVTVDVQQFNSTGTWTKPTGGQTMARIMVWGGGGGGGGALPGYGGGYNEQIVPLSWLSSTVTATIGAGGGGAAGTGGNGGSSSFALSTALNGKTSVTVGGGFGGTASLYTGRVTALPYLYMGGGWYYSEYGEGAQVFGSPYANYGGGMGSVSYLASGFPSVWGGDGGSWQQPGNAPGGGGSVGGTAGASGRIIVMCW